MYRGGELICEREEGVGREDEEGRRRREFHLVFEPVQNRSLPEKGGAVPRRVRRRKKNLWGSRLGIVDEPVD